jgi:hypothetical protein
MTDHPTNSPQRKPYQMTVMELAVICWVVTILISLDEQIPPKLDPIEIVGIAISGTITLIALVGPLILLIMQRKKDSGADKAEASSPPSQR